MSGMPGKGFIVHRASFFELRHGKPGAPLLRGEPPDGGCVATYVPISAAGSTFVVWSTRRGGRGARRCEDTSPLHSVCGSWAACSHPVVAASHGRSETPPQITVGQGWVCGTHPSSGMAAYCNAGVPGVCVVAHHRLHSCADSAPTMCASHALMELLPMTDGGKSAPRRCWGSSWVRHSRVPFTRWRLATKFLLETRGRGGTVVLRCSEPSVHPGRSVGRAGELLQPVVAELPLEVPLPEHVLEELAHRGPPWWVVAGSRAELRLCCLRHQPKTENLRLLGAGGAPRGDPQRIVPGREVLCRFLDSLAVVGPGEQRMGAAHVHVHRGLFPAPAEEAMR